MKILISIIIVVCCLFTTNLQQQHTQVNLSEYTCMLAVLWHEARGEVEQGIHAVASVVINRTKHKNYPSTICGVVVQNKQFTGIYNTLSRALNTPTSLQNDRGYTKVSTIAFHALYGRFKPSVNALDYHTVGHKVYWSKHLKNRRVIGKHVFFVVHSPTSKR